MIPHQIAVQPLRTMTHLSRALDMAVFGIQPWGFHLSNVIWHAINALLVFSIAWLVLEPWGAIAAGIIFAWHPIQVEAVAYVSARADLVSTCGVLLALLSASRGSLTGALLGVVFASLAKESAVVAWGLVLLWAAWTPQARFLRWWTVITGIGLVLGAGLVLQEIYWARLVTLNLTLAGTQLAVIGRLLLLLPVPYGFTLDHDWASLTWLAPFALVAALGLTAWALTLGWAARSWLALAWLWTLVALCPRLILPLPEGLHERHMYPVLIGWALCAGAWLSHPTARRMTDYGFD